jgi:hypothetical protein
VRDFSSDSLFHAIAQLLSPVCLLAGRTKAIKKFHEHTPGFQDAEINARLVAYCSDQAHSSVEKAALIGLVRMRFIEADGNLSLRGGALKEAIEEDIKNGLIPFWVSFFRFLIRNSVAARERKSHKKICHEGGIHSFNRWSSLLSSLPRRQATRCEINDDDGMAIINMITN